MMKMMWVAVVCSLSCLAVVGCGKKEAETPAVEQEQAPKKTGNVVLDNLANEPEPL